MKMQNPVETPDGYGGVRMTHPAFGAIVLTKVRSSAGVPLYGSDFRHGEFLSIEIRGSELIRDLSTDSPHPTDTIVRLNMSTAQWAEFVSSIGVGEGVQCTLKRVNGQDVPRLPFRDAGKLHAKEGIERVREVERVLEDLKNSLENDEFASLPPKKRVSALAKIETARNRLAPNLEFIVSNFSDYIEKRVAKAKIEVHAWMTNIVQRTGLKAIARSEGYPLRLEGEHDGMEDEDKVAFRP